MTLERLIETGSGKLAARVEIEGLPIQFVSDAGMERTDSDGRRRIYCWCPFGEGASTLTIEESVNIPEAVLEAGGVTLRLYETQDEDLAGALHHAPERFHYVTENAEDTDTTIFMLDTTGITAGDIVHIGTEAVYVGAVDTNRIYACLRGHWGTIARDIWTTPDGSGVELAAIATDKPLRARGRRVRIYLYGDGDDLQGDGGNGGEPVWRGMVTTDPRWDQAGSSVSLSIGPLTKLLETKLGGDLGEPLRPRGIYYSWAAPLCIQVKELDGPSNTWTDPPAELKFTGHYETQQAFIDALTTAMTSEFSALASDFAAVLTPDGGWTIEITSGSDVTAASAWAWSHQDGETTPFPEQMLNEDGEAVGTNLLTLGDKIYAPWMLSPAGGRGVPRGVFGMPMGGLGTFAGDDGSPQVPADAAVFPETRVYVDRTPETDWTSVLASWPPAIDAERPQSVAVNAASGYITLGLAGVPAGGTVNWALYTPLSPAEFRPRRNLSAGGLEDLRAALVAESIAYADRGTAPFITDEDVASWADVAAAAERFSWQRVRHYELTDAVDLDEFLAAEFRLRCVFPVTDSTGKIAIAQAKLPSTTVAAVAAIDEEIVTAGWSSMERGGQTVNRWKLKTGYDPLSDEWSGFTAAFDTRSYALDHQDRTLDIEPRSASGMGDHRIPREEVAAAALPILGLFGYPYDIVTINVSWKLFELRLGDVVTFSADHLPSYATGRRPVTEVLGVVIGRRWTIGEAHGELRILVSWTRPAGYSPSVRITDQSNVSANRWSLECTGVAYPTGTDHNDWFAVGDRVRVRKRDSETADAINGTVFTRSALLIVVDFDSAWTPGLASWGLGFAPYTDSLVTEEQKRFAAIAGDDAVLGADDQSRTYGP